MIAKQSVHCEYLIDDLRIEIRMGIQLPISDDPTVNISIGMNFQSQFPVELEDIFYPRIYNGIHAGIGYSNIPLDPPSLEITVFELQLSPPIQEIDIHKYTKRLGYLLEVTAFGILQALFRGLNNLDKGEEIYYSY